MQEVTFRTHWLAFTVHAPSEEAFILYDLFFKEIFGGLESLGHGGRAFKEILHGLMEIKLYVYPTNMQANYFHIEIPGGACDSLNWNFFHGLWDYLDSNFKDRCQVTRFDFAFDGVPFTPQQFEQAICEDRIRSLAKRKTLRIESSPFMNRDDGQLGTDTVYFGANTSERMVRVYNKRGPTRLEFQMKEDRANLVAPQVFRSSDADQSFYIVLCHLLDFIDINTDWWKDFKDCTARANATVTKVTDLSTAKMINWLNKQVAPALSVAVDALPPAVLDSIIRHGRSRRGPKYGLILEQGKK